MKRTTKKQPSTPPQMPPALQALATPIAELRPDPHNARQHNERNLAAVRASLERFGWRGVVVARKADGVILAGHARIEAAKQLGWTHAPVMFTDDDSAMGIAFAIADNRSAELAAWDFDMLSEGLRELDRDAARAIGFNDAELDSLLNLESYTMTLDEAGLREQDAIGQAAAVARDQVLIKVLVPRPTAAMLRVALEVVIGKFDGASIQ